MVAALLCAGTLEGCTGRRPAANQDPCANNPCVRTYGPGWYCDPGPPQFCRPPDHPDPEPGPGPVAVYGPPPGPPPAYGPPLVVPQAYGPPIAQPPAPPTPTPRRPPGPASSLYGPPTVDPGV
jgi:hypothetical protein